MNTNAPATSIGRALPQDVGDTVWIEDLASYAKISAPLGGVLAYLTRRRNWENSLKVVLNEDTIVSGIENNLFYDSSTIYNYANRAVEVDAPSTS